MRSIRAWLSATARTQPLVLLVLGSVVGALGGGAAIVFHWLIGLCQHLALGGEEWPVTLLSHMDWYWLLIIPTAGGFLVAPIVYGWASEARGHGVPEVMEAVQVRGGQMRPRVAAAKSIASAITIGTGGSVGREGPVVQIGAALGSVAGSLFRLSAEQCRTLVGCGAAAGIAATFNAPIAGAFFALEVILGNFAIPTFSPIVLASVVATVVSRAYFGNYPAFTIPEYDLVAWWELAPYALLGAACGAAAVCFTWILYGLEDVFERSPIPPLLRPALGGLLMGGFLILSPHLYGSGFESIDRLLHGHILWTVALALVGLKILACSVTLASGGSGGVFSPALFIGATIGHTVGWGMNSWDLGAVGSPAAYAMVGMGAFLSGATHAPVASLLILFELTNDYGIILPLMLAITMSTLVARALTSDSIYTRKLHRKGIRLFGARDDVVMNSFRVRDVMRRKIPTVSTGASFATVMDRFLGAPIDELFVVDDQNRLRGAVSLHDIKGVLAEEELHQIVTASDLMREAVPVARPEDTLADCLQQLTTSDRDALPVVADGRELIPVGVITRKDLLDLYDREVLRREMLGTHAAQESGRPAALPAGHRLRTLTIPEAWDGSSLRDLALRPRTGVTVLGIVPRDAENGAQPAAADTPLRAGDRLVVLGTIKSVAAVEQLASGGE